MNDVAKQTEDITIRDLERLEDAIRLAEEMLEDCNLSMPPTKKAKLVSLIYAVLDDEEEDLLTIIHAFLAEEDE